MKNQLITPKGPPSMDDKVIPTYLFNVVGSILKEQAIAPEEMIVGTGLSLEVLYDQQTRISFRQAIHIFSNALSLSSDSALGLAVAARECFSDWGVLGYAIASCRCPEEAIEYSNRLYGATTNLTVMYSGQEEGTYVTYATPTFPVGAIQPCLIEETFGGIVNVLRSLTESPGSPKEVQLSYAEPSYSQRYRQFFQCPIRFNCSANKVIWHKEFARQPFKTYNPTTAKLAVKLCEQFLSETQNQRGLVYNIRCRLLRSPGNFPSVRAVAAEFGTSERSLSRALKNLGSSFQSILDEVRQTIATEYLISSELRLEDIAFLVGFSDASNFHRAFKKWTGKPPTAFRKRPVLS